MVLPLQPKPTTPVFNAADPAAFGIVAALPCDRINGGTTVPDVTPFGFNATINGGVSVFADPTIGNVIQLDGTSGYLALNAAINAALNGQAAASVSFWLRLRNDVAASVAKAGFANLQGLSGVSAASQWAAPGNIANMATFRASSRITNIALGNSLPFPSAGIVNKTSWHLVTITTVNGGFYKVYLNANIVYSNTAEGPVSVLLSPIVGKSSDGSGNYFLDGWIGDIRLWNRELQLNEIESQVNNPWGLYIAGPPPGELDSLFTELPGSARQYGQARERSVMVEALAQKFTVAAALRSPFVELAVRPGALASFQQGIDPRIKPTLPVLDVSDPITTGLVLAVPFYEGSGLTAHDLSGNGFNAAQVGSGVGWTSGAFRSGAFSFAGYQGNATVFSPAGFPASAFARYFNVPRQAALEPTAFTIAAWCRPTNNQVNRGVVAKRTAVGPPGSVYSYFIGTSPFDGSRFAAQMSDLIDSPDILQGNPHTFDGNHVYHVAFSYDPTELPSGIMRLYVNGVLENTLPNSGNPAYDATKDVHIGDDGSGASVFDGAIDLATIWSRKLSDAEIRQLAGGPESDFVLAGGMGLFTLGGVASGLMVELAALQAPSAARARSVFSEVAMKQAPQNGLRSLVVELAAQAPAQNVAGMQVASITPTFGPQNGGTAVTIKGVHFQNITQVLLGGSPLSSLVVVDPFTITGVTPAHVPGLVDLEVDSSTVSFVIKKNAFSYTPSGSASNALIRGMQIDPRAIRQERFTGLTATQGVDTILAGLNLSDLAQGAGSVMLFLDNSNVGAGGKFMRPGVDYNYLPATGQVMWLHTAAVGINLTDIVTVRFIAQGNTA